MSWSQHGPLTAVCGAALLVAHPPLTCGAVTPAVLSASFLCSPYSKQIVPVKASQELPATARHQQSAAGLRTAGAHQQLQMQQQVQQDH
jgi:hypothetical protein